MNYFQKPLGINHVPNFVKAKSSAGLRRAMFLNNKKQKGFVVYENIQFAKGSWWAWYYVTEDVQGMTEILTGET